VSIKQWVGVAKMLKFTTFHGASSREIETKINQWLSDDGEKIEILHVTQSEGEREITICIFFKYNG
jgi:hypothetical protein